MCICSCKQAPRILTTTWFDMAPAPTCSIYLGTTWVIAQSGRQLRAACWRSTVVAGQAGNVTAGLQVRQSARFVKLLRFCILTTAMGLADGGSCATGASAFTMVVVGSGVIVRVTVRDHSQKGAPCGGITSA
jgi:hypothetical protein